MRPQGVTVTAPRRARAAAVVVAAALAVAVAGVQAVQPSSAESAPVEDPATPTTVTEDGVGAVQVPPDVATVVVRIGNVEPTVAAAVDRNAAVVRRVRAALGRGGVGAGDVRAIDMFVSAARAEGRMARSAGRELHVTMRNVRRAQQVVAEIARVGGTATRIMQFSYGVADPAPYVAGARAAAVAEAREPAERGAKALGKRLGAVRTVVETEGWSVGFRYAGSSGPGEVSASHGTAEVPPPPSALPVSVRTRVTWELAPLEGMAPKPGRVTVLGIGSAGKPAEFIRTHFFLWGWGTSQAAAQRAADPAIRRLRVALRAAGVEEDDVRADPVRMLDTYSRSRKAAGWTAYCGFEVRLRDMAHAERILESVAKKVGNPTRMFGLDPGIGSQEGLLGKAESAARADAKSTATQYARIAGRPLGKVVEVRRAYGYGASTPTPRRPPRPGTRCRTACAEAGAKACPRRQTVTSRATNLITPGRPGPSPRPARCASWRARFGRRQRSERRRGEGH